MQGTSKYDGENGMHRVPVWRIAGYALNNTATNQYLFIMGYVAYYLNGFVGMATVLAGSFSMIMRLWDGITDPFIGYLIDKTTTKFGKNRPFMVIGNIILCVTSFVLFHVTHHLPDNAALRSAFFIIVSMLYYIGYTFQCVVTKSAQTCVTNDPKQRPLFTVFDGTFCTAMNALRGIYVASYLIPKYGSFYDTGLFHEMWLTSAIFSAVCTAIAVISIAPKDKPKYFGTGNTAKIKMRDYVDVLMHNRAIQMLVLSASTDKLAAQSNTSVVVTVMFGIVVGKFALSGGYTAYTSLAVFLFLIVGVGGIATRLGQRKAMMIGTYGGLVTSAMLIALWLFGNPQSFNLPGYEGYTGLTFFTVAFILLSCIQQGFMRITSSIVIPMTADCADYEVYRSGRYVPGLMGTLFSAVDKFVSSFAPMVASVLFAMIGFKTTMPDVNTPYSASLLYVGIFLMYGMPILGLICNTIGMKFYPLTKEKMAEIQEEIAAIKAASVKETA